MKDEKLIDSINDDYSMRLFNKHEYQLSYSEQNTLQDYIYDVTHPIWKTWTEPDGCSIIEASCLGEFRFKNSQKPVYLVKRSDGTHYVMIFFRYNGKEYIRSAHRIIATLFVPNPENKPEVNHIDGNKWNNWYRNLEWVTASENMKHAFRTGLLPSQKGEDNRASKYSNEQIRQVCELLRDHPDWTMQKIADKAGVTESTVGDVYRNNEWKHLSVDYEFPERETRARGEAVGNNRYSEAQVEHTCQLLCDHPDWTYERISYETGIDAGSVKAISRHQVWNQISDKYDLPVRDCRPKGEAVWTSKATASAIENVCSLLDQVYHGEVKLSHQQIADQCGITRNMVDDVSAGRAWKEVAENHPFYQKRKIS